MLWFAEMQRPGLPLGIALLHSLPPARLPAAAAGGRVALHCHCTTGVHDHCLMQWLLSGNGRENLEACELCTGTWQGAITGGWVRGVR